MKQEENFDPNDMWEDDSHISLRWLQEVTGLSVSSCTAEDVSNAMRKGTRIRDGATIRLSLSLDDRNEAMGQPETLIIKQAVTDQGKALSKQLGLSREALFYERSGPKIAQVIPNALPKIYHSMGNFDSDGSKVIVMEDISGVDSGIFFGPGNPNNWNRNLKELMKEVPDNPTAEKVAMITFQEFAKIHALFWRDMDLLSENYHWLRGQNWLQGKGKESWMASQQMIQAFWAKYVKAEEDDFQNLSASTITWDPLVREAVEKAMKGISWESQMDRLNKAGHFTLVHGDFWPGNILWLKDRVERQDRNIKFVDWEMVGLGSGPQELGQYVISNMDPSVRKQCEDSLVRAYYQQLQSSAKAKDAMTWEECWAEYQVGGVERWLWFLVYFIGQPAMSDWAQFFHNQICAFMKDHNMSADQITQPRP